MLIDWDSTDTHVLLNPRMIQALKKRFEAILEHPQKVQGHVWLCTSGSSELKLVALSKEGILLSAESVNKHINSNSKDIWVNALPIFHVGGMSIYARSHLSGALVHNFFEEKWNPKKFQQVLTGTSATLTSLVPTQVFDLIAEKLRAPKTLRVVFLGGGTISNALYQKAVQLGWKLLPSYGMTESASQIATASLEQKDLENLPALQILPHMQVTENAEGALCLTSKSLLSAYAIDDEPNGFRIVDPKINGSFVTQDMGQVIGTNNQLKVWGRTGDFFKIGGENVHVGRLEGILEEIKLKHKSIDDMALIAMPDERLVNVIQLVSEAKEEAAIEPIVNEYQQKVMPFERIRKVHCISKIPRSPLGKLLRSDLQKLLKSEV